jgi:hypothetical protein
LRAQGSQYVPVAGHGTRFRARNLFHGVDQHRQPGALVGFRSPRPELLTHRLSSACPGDALGVLPTPKVARLFRTSCPISCLISFFIHRTGKKFRRM